MQSALMGGGGKSKEISCPADKAALIPPRQHFSRRIILRTFVGPKNDMVPLLKFPFTGLDHLEELVRRDCRCILKGPFGNRRFSDNLDGITYHDTYTIDRPAGLGFPVFHGELQKSVAALVLAFGDVEETKMDNVHCPVGERERNDGVG